MAHGPLVKISGDHDPKLHVKRALIITLILGKCPRGQSYRPHYMSFEYYNG